MPLKSVAKARRRWKRRTKLRHLRKKWLKARSQSEKDALVAKMRRVSPTAPLPQAK